MESVGANSESRVRESSYVWKGTYVTPAQETAPTKLGPWQREVPTVQGPGGGYMGASCSLPGA